MRTINKEIKLFSLDELDQRARDRAIDSLRGAQVDHDWWDCTYDDAKRVGLKITSFDLDRSRHAEGEFIDGALNCANAILKEHGEGCETRSDALTFLTAFDALPDQDSDDYRDDDFDEIEGEFLKALCESYSLILQREYEYLTSDEAIEEMIAANEYEFTEEGDLY